MESLSIATAQFEHRSGDKPYNLAVIRHLAERAAASGAKVIAFHECSVTGYTFARRLSREQMLELAELIAEGESVQELIRIARETGLTVLAGLFEKDAEDRLYKAYVCVNGDGLVARFRKLHPFINPHRPASGRVAPSSRAARKPATKQSPAPVVSFTATSNAGHRYSSRCV